MNSTAPERDPRVYLAVERTFLAWLRTGLAMMGFGFVVARFSLFLQELAAGHGPTTLPQTSISTRLGTALVMAGVAVIAGSVVRYVRLLRSIDRGDPLREPSRLAIGLAVAVAVIGSLLSLRLLGVR